MRIQKKQIFLIIFWLAALLAFLQLFQVSAHGESEGDKATKKFKDNVVQLSVNFSNGRSENGFGFVTGERGDLLYVVTANHVVRKDEPDVQMTDIEARFYSDRGKPKKAELLELSAGSQDLALLEVPRPFPGYRWETNYFSSPQKGTKVWFIGRDGEWWVPADNEAGVVQDLPIEPEFTVRIGSVLPGTSGAPLISKEGIIGMIIKDDISGMAEALDIEIISKFVENKWNYPWGLKQSGGKTTTTEPTGTSGSTSTTPADVKEHTKRGQAGKFVISGRVFDSDSNKPLSGVWIDLYRDLSSIQQRPQRLKAGAATTGPYGKFSINCGWVKESQFPLLLAVRHRDWVATRITGPKIERNGEWDGINIPIPMSEIGLKALREISVSFRSRKIGSDRFLIGEVKNKSERSFPCVRVRFKMTTSYQDHLQGEPKRDLGFLEVEVRNIGPHEKKPYQKKLPGRVGIGLHSKEECQ